MVEVVVVVLGGSGRGRNSGSGSSGSGSGRSGDGVGSVRYTCSFMINFSGVEKCDSKSGSGSLFTVLYFSVRLSRSRALHYRLPILHECQNYLGGGGSIFLAPPPPELKSPTPTPLVHLKIKIAVTVRRSISKRSHEKIGDCEQSMEVVTERVSITFTSHSKHEFVPRDQVSPFLCYCSLLLHIN